MAKGLTTNQRNVLEYVQRFLQENGYPPTLREIGLGASIKSLRGVAIHLDALQRKGFIERGSQARSIRIVHPAYGTGYDKVAFLPLVGTIAAGAPILAQENIEDMIPVPIGMVRNIQDAFLLQVRGDSMIGEHILPRDIVVIRPDKTAYDGELVAVQVGDEATIKRIRYNKDKRTVSLLSANPAYEPIEAPASEARVIGKVVGLIRNYGEMVY